ncbi:hypothetical protein Har1131_18745 [Haloarcula sp. CBA1131]|uniref:DUF7389 domain-containing protein n=1 Tax=Haloarcula sp. CBA1131 TaxID=1853686 RepID=UPI00124578B0|nr:hypothetical protein [Haloarcula sp. CBA1131]KAA9400716.1 hypothetical protein Har1131_18745 [Haloarcula sp. CBA1131]
MSLETNDEPAAASGAVETVERTDIGSSMEARLKRGTGTRDEDSVTIKAKGRTAEETIEEFYKLLVEYEAEVSGRLRDIQPGEDDE